MHPSHVIYTCRLFYMNCNSLLDNLNQAMSVTGSLYRTTNDAFNIKCGVPITLTHVLYIDGKDHLVKKNKGVKDNMDGVDSDV